MWNDATAFIRDVGFPIFVATYLLLVLHPEIRKMRGAMDLLFWKLTGESPRKNTPSPGAKSLLLFVTAAILAASSCAYVPPFEACYLHPTYGEICVRWEGGRFKIVAAGTATSPTDRSLLEKWIAEQPAPNR